MDHKFANQLKRDSQGRSAFMHSKEISQERELKNMARDAKYYNDGGYSMRNNGFRAAMVFDTFEETGKELSNNLAFKGGFEHGKKMLKIMMIDYQAGFDDAINSNQNRKTPKTEDAYSYLANFLGYTNGKRKLAKANYDEDVLRSLRVMAIRYLDGYRDGLHSFFNKEILDGEVENLMAYNMGYTDGDAMLHSKLANGTKGRRR